jgi:hypothetical protein
MKFPSAFTQCLAMYKTTDPESGKWKRNNISAGTCFWQKSALAAKLTLDITVPGRLIALSS